MKLSGVDGMAYYIIRYTARNKANNYSTNFLNI